MAYVHVSMFVIIIDILHPTEGMRILHGRITLEIMIQFIIRTSSVRWVHVYAHGTLI